MSETRTNRNGSTTTQVDGATVSTGSMLINTWTVDRVTERGAVVKLVSETRYAGARLAGARDTTWVVVTGRRQISSFAGTRREARARIGA